MELIVGKTFSYDPLDEDYEDDFGSLDKELQAQQKKRVKRRLDDYLEQKRLKRNLGEDDLDFLDD
nr:hypothetical protein [Pseudoalteromonas sp. XMcav2-N]